MLNYKLYNIQAQMNNVVNDTYSWQGQIVPGADLSDALSHAALSVRDIANAMNDLIMTMEEEHNKEHVCPYCGANLKEET